jgi:ADP-heptose:LPS heptosyltransferase
MSADPQASGPAGPAGAGEPRLLILLLTYGDSYPGAEARLLRLAESIGLPRRLILIRNERPDLPCRRLDHWRFELGGDNRAFEFSGWQLGLDSAPARDFGADVVLFANSSFVTHGFHSLPLIDADLVRYVARGRRIGGRIRRVGYGLHWEGLDLARWAVTHCFLANAQAIGDLGSVVTHWSADRFLAPEYGPACRTGDGLWSAPLGRYLWTGLTRKYRGTGRALSAEDYGFFRRKVLSIVNEMCLSARLVRAGCDLVDLTPWPRLLNSPAVLALGPTEIRPFQFLRRVLLDGLGRLASPGGVPSQGADPLDPLAALCLRGLKRGLKRGLGIETGTGGPRIAILSAAGLGDLITAGPLIRGLNARFPGARIRIYTERQGPLAGMPLAGIEGVVEYAPATIWRVLLGERHDLLLAWGAQSKIFARHRRLAYGLLIRLFPARRRIYYRRGDLPVLAGKCIVDVKLGLLGRLGPVSGPQDRRLGLPFTPESPGELLPPLGGRPLAVFHIGAKSGHTSRSWPVERWVETARFVAETYGAAICFVGGPDEVQESRLVLAGLGLPAIDLVGRLDLAQTAGVIERAGLVVSTNSGPMWVAAALGKYQVALCGPSRPEWEPCQPKAVTLRSPIDRPGCRPPCDRPTCAYGDRACMLAIGAQAAIAAIRGLPWARSGVLPAGPLDERLEEPRERRGTGPAGEVQAHPIPGPGGEPEGEAAIGGEPAHRGGDLGGGALGHQ